jgi:hypothetical protein
MTAVLVIGFDIEQIRKIASFCIGFARLAVGHALRASNQATWPCRITSVTAPAIACRRCPAARPRQSSEAHLLALLGLLEACGIYIDRTPAKPLSMSLIVGCVNNRALLS